MRRKCEEAGQDESIKGNSEDKKQEKSLEKI